VACKKGKAYLPINIITLIITKTYRVLIIFGPTRDEVTGEWRRLHKEELNDLYCSSNIERAMKSKRL
jgi:hypothetical protein